MFKFLDKVCRSSVSQVRSFHKNNAQRSGLGEGGEIEFRQPGTEAQYCYKS